MTKTTQAIPVRKRRQIASLAVPRPATVEEAIELQADAAIRRGIARQNADCPEAAQCWDDQASLAERRAAKRLKLAGPPVIGTGGEMLLPPDDANPWRDTLRQDPDQVAASASNSRIQLAAQAGVLTDALDAAETMKARNSIEKMLAHQLAALHKLSMEFAGASADMLRKLNISTDSNRRQQLSIEAARLAGAAGRCSTVYQEGMAQAQRSRQGNRQTIVVQYMLVSRGAQAILNNGKMTGLGQRKRRKGMNGHQGGYPV